MVTPDSGVPWCHEPHHDSTVTKSQKADPVLKNNLRTLMSLLLPMWCRGRRPHPHQTRGEKNNSYLEDVAVPLHPSPLFLREIRVTVVEEFLGWDLDNLEQLCFVWCEGGFHSQAPGMK